MWAAWSVNLCCAQHVNALSGLSVSMRTGTLAQLLMVIVDRIPHMEASAHHTLDMLARGIERVGAAEESVLQCDRSGLMVTGNEFKVKILETIRARKWPSELAVAMVNMHRDLNLSTEQVEDVVVKALRQLRKMDIQDAPAMIYALLILASKGARSSTVRGIVEHFHALDSKQKQQAAKDNQDETQKELEAANLKKLRHAQGTVILNVNFVVKQDPELAKTLIAFMKSKGYSALTPFNISLMLSIARIHRHQQRVFEILQSAVVEYHVEASRRKASDWHKAIANAPPLTDVDNVLSEMIDYCQFG